MKFVAVSLALCLLAGTASAFIIRGEDCCDNPSSLCKHNTDPYCYTIFHPGTNDQCFPGSTPCSDFDFEPNPLIFTFETHVDQEVPSTRAVEVDDDTVFPDDTQFTPDFVTSTIGLKSADFSFSRALPAKTNQKSGHQARGSCAVWTAGEENFVIFCQHNIDTGADEFFGTQSHIHKGPRGINGPVVLEFDTDRTDPENPTSPNNPSFFGPLEGNLRDISQDDFICALTYGQLYVNHHSTEFPAGEIRGQIDRSSNFVLFSDEEGDERVLGTCSFDLMNNDVLPPQAGTEDPQFKVILTVACLHANTEADVAFIVLGDDTVLPAVTGPVTGNGGGEFNVIEAVGAGAGAPLTVFVDFLATRDEIINLIAGSVVVISGESQTLFGLMANDPDFRLPSTEVECPRV